MKKLLIRFISIVLICVLMTITMSSCGFWNDKSEQINKENNEPNINNTEAETQKKSYYYCVKTLFSYDEVMDALEIVRKKREVKSTYTVDDMGDDYTVFYQFRVDHCWTEYPIDYETYFTTKSRGRFYTYIFLENQSCPGHNNYAYHGSVSLMAYKEDEDYDKLVKCIKSNACILIEHSMMKEAVEIEDKSLLRYSETLNEDGAMYFISYNRETIFSLISCVKLDEAFFETFFDSIVTTKCTE